MLLFFFSFLFFCRGRDIFAKIKHTKLTYYSTFISRIQHKISIFFLLFFRETDVVNRSSFIFSSLGFSFGLSFLTFFKWWQWLEGHSFGLVLGIFVFVLNYSDLFGLLGRLGLGNHSKNFSGNLVKLGFHFVQNGVNLGLV